VDDREIERRVDAALARGMKRPSWNWKPLGPYNGATGSERVIAWQKLIVACRMGLLPWAYPLTCSICGAGGKNGYHGENYFRPLYLTPVCKSCHTLTHIRFKYPARWQRLLNDYPNPDAWYARISFTELTREQSQMMAERDDPVDCRQIRLTM